MKQVSLYSIFQALSNDILQYIFCDSLKKSPTPLPLASGKLVDFSVHGGLRQGTSVRVC